MPIVYDLRKDIRFKEGKVEQARFSTIGLLKRGILSPVEIAEIQNVSLDFVLKIQKKLQKKIKSMPNLS